MGVFLSDGACNRQASLVLYFVGTIFVIAARATMDISVIIFTLKNCHVVLIIE